MEFPDLPAHWGWGKTAYGLLGTLARSGRWRSYLSSSMDQAHLIEGLDQVSRKLGGLTQRWRFDRMATVAQPGTGEVTKSFAHVAKHYGVGVDICPPRRGNRKGVVEKAIHGAAQRWWRTLPEDLTPQQAQVSWDAFCVRVIDPRRRVIDEVRATIAEHAEAEPLRVLPQVAYPATITETRVVSAQALVAWRGNHYSVTPQLALSSVTVSQRLGEPYIDITTPSGVVIARHATAPDGIGAVIRTDTHVSELTSVVLGAFTTARPHRRKERLPVSEQAHALLPAAPTQPTAPSDVVIDLTAWAKAAEGRNTLQ